MGALAALIVVFFSAIPTTAIITMTAVVIVLPFGYAYLSSKKLKESNTELVTIKKKNDLLDLYDFTNITPEDFNIKDEQVIHNAAREFGLNPLLAVRQRISIGNLKKLRVLHLKLDKLILESTAIEAKDSLSKSRLKNIGLEVEAIEYLMQDEWKFLRSVSHHTHYRRINNCSCSLSSSAYKEDSWGSGVTIDSGCIVHNGT